MKIQYKNNPMIIFIANFHNQANKTTNRQNSENKQTRKQILTDDQIKMKRKTQFQCIPIQAQSSKLKQQIQWKTPNAKKNKA